MLVYKGLEYTVSKNAYEVFDRGRLTNEKILLAGGDGIEDPESRAKQRIEEILKCVELNAKG